MTVKLRSRSHNGVTDYINDVSRNIEYRLAVCVIIGAVYVFKRNGTRYSEASTLIIPRDGRKYGGFGEFVAIDQNNIFISGTDNANQFNVYIYSTSDPYNIIQKVHLSGAAYEYKGIVVMDSTTFLVGCKDSVYVVRYETNRFNNNEWRVKENITCKAVMYFTASKDQIAISTESGVYIYNKDSYEKSDDYPQRIDVCPGGSKSLAMDQRHLLISCKDILVFQRYGNWWKYSYPSIAKQSKWECFGRNMRLYGDDMVIASNENENYGRMEKLGEMQVFKKKNGNWSMVTKLRSRCGFDHFEMGKSLAMYDTFVFASGKGTPRGVRSRVYMFDLKKIWLTKGQNKVSLVTVSMCTPFRAASYMVVLSFIVFIQYIYFI